MSVYSDSWHLLVLQIRTGWRSLLLSPIVLAGLVAAVAVGVKELYADATKRAGGVRAEAPHDRRDDQRQDGEDQPDRHHRAHDRA